MWTAIRSDCKSIIIPLQWRANVSAQDHEGVGCISLYRKARLFFSVQSSFSLRIAKSTFLITPVVRLLFTSAFTHARVENAAAERSSSLLGGILTYISRAPGSGGLTFI